MRRADAFIIALAVVFMGGAVFVMAIIPCVGRARVRTVPRLLRCE